MKEKDWISLVAIHTDGWLLAVEFYFGVCSRFEKNDNIRLFNMIDELVTKTAKKKTKEKHSVGNQNDNKKCVLPLK